LQNLQIVVENCDLVAKKVITSLPLLKLDGRIDIVSSTQSYNANPLWGEVHHMGGSHGYFFTGQLHP